jgi:hypothetical protein
LFTLPASHCSQPAWTLKSPPQKGRSHAQPLIDDGAAGRGKTPRSIARRPQYSHNINK